MKNAAMYTLLMLTLTLTLALADSACAETGKSTSASGSHPDCTKQKAAVSRRAVPREVERRPPAPPPAPIAVPRPTPPAAVVQPVKPGAPTPITSCDPGGCRDTGGNRYNGATGNTYLDQNGKPCSRNGTWVQCF